MTGTHLGRGGCEEAVQWQAALPQEALPQGPLAHRRHGRAVSGVLIKLGASIVAGNDGCIGF